MIERSDRWRFRQAVTSGRVAACTTRTGSATALKRKIRHFNSVLTARYRSILAGFAAVVIISENKIGTSPLLTRHSVWPLARIYCGAPMRCGLPMRADSVAVKKLVPRGCAGSNAIAPRQRR
jgi:hypothetical protein